MNLTDIFYILKKHKERTTFWAAMSLLVLIVINRAGAYKGPVGTVSAGEKCVPSALAEGLSQNSEGSVPIFSLPSKKPSNPGGRDIFIPLSSPLAGEGKGEGEQYIEGTLPEETPKEEAFPYIFTGVIEMKGEQIAVLESTGNYKVHFKRKGEEISEMKVIEIDKSRLVLKSEEGKEITLDRKIK